MKIHGKINNLKVWKTETLPLLLCSRSRHVAIAYCELIAVFVYKTSFFMLNKGSMYGRSTPSNRSIFMFYRMIINDLQCNAWCITFKKQLTIYRSFWEWLFYEELSFRHHLQHYSGTTITTEKDSIVHVGSWASLLPKFISINGKSRFDQLATTIT